MRKTTIIITSILLVTFMAMTNAAGQDDPYCNPEGSFLLLKSSETCPGPYTVTITMQNVNEGVIEGSWSNPFFPGICYESKTLTNGMGQIRRTGNGSFVFTMIYMFVGDNLDAKYIAKATGRLDLDGTCNSGESQIYDLELYEPDKNPFVDDPKETVLAVGGPFELVRIEHAMPQTRTWEPDVPTTWPGAPERMRDYRDYDY